MADRSVTVELKLDIADYLAKLRVAERETKAFGDQGAPATKQLDEETKKLASDVEDVGKKAETAGKKHVDANKKVTSSYRDTRLWVLGLTAALTNLPAVVAPALGLLLAVPGALALAGTAAGTTAIALHGVGDAFKAIGKGDVDKISAAMAGLAPSARAFVLEVQSVRSEWSALGRDVQQSFFGQFGGSLTDLTNKLLPMLRVELPQVGAALGDIARSTADWAGSTASVQRLAALISDIARVLREHERVMQPWADAFLDLSRFAVPILSGLLRIIEELGVRFKAWVTAAQASGQLDQLFRTTGVAVRELLDLVSRLSDAIFILLSSPGVMSAAKFLFGLFDALANVLVGLTTVFTMLPSPIQSVVLVLLALAGLAPLVAKGIGGISNAVNNLNIALGNVREKGFGALMGVLGGPWGLAITAATIGLGFLGAKMAEQKQKAEQAAQAYLEFGDAVKQARVSGGDSVESLIRHDKAIQDLILDAHKYGVSTLEVVNALAGEKDAHEAVLTELQARRQELENQMAAQERVVTGDRVEAAIKADKIKTIQDEIDKVDALTGQFDRVATEQGRAAAAADLYARSQAGAAGISGTLSAQYNQLNALLVVLQSNTATASQKADALKASMDSLFGAQISVSEASEKYEASIDTLSNTVAKNVDALKQNKNALDDNATSLSIHTETGRANRDMIEAIIQASLDMTDADIRNGDSLEVATAKHNNRIDALRREAENLGFTKKDTEALITVYGQVPGDVTTDVRATGIQGVLQQLQDLRIAQLALQQGIDVFQARKEFRNQGGFGVGGLAAGGPVIGPGTGTSDSIPAIGPWGARLRLSNGEHVWTAEEVRAAGGHEALIWLRQMVLHGLSPHAKYPGDGSQGIKFAAGGPVEVWPFPVKVTAKLPTMAELEAKWGGGPALAFLKRVQGSPYGWAQAGPNAWDCSGIISSVWNILHNQNPYNHTFSTFNEAGYFPLAGIGGKLTAGWSNPGEGGPGGGWNDVGHTAGLLMGRYKFESTGSGGVRLGDGVTDVRSFAHVGHFDRGGYLQPGWTLAYNGTGSPEPVGTTRNGIAVDVYVRDDTGRMFTVIRKEVRTKYGGDVQSALGF